MHMYVVFGAVTLQWVVNVDVTIYIYMYEVRVSVGHCSLFYEVIGPSARYRERSC